MRFWLRRSVSKLAPQDTSGRVDVLRQQLQQHTPACDEETVYRARMLELLGSTGDPLSRNHFEPGHFTASGFVLSPDGKSVLLILHKKLERWLQPGGHVDPEDSDLFTAACREIREEVGIEGVSLEQPGVFDVDIHPIPARKAEPDHEHFDVRFLMRAQTTEITRNDETHDAKWTPVDALAQRMTGVDEARVIRKLAKWAAR
jgi:8-oxo-dGTP pyrophosphatase MutT (NUDIX family)